MKKFSLSLATLAAVVILTSCNTAPAPETSPKVTTTSEDVKQHSPTTVVPAPAPSPPRTTATTVSPKPMKTAPAKTSPPPKVKTAPPKPAVKTTPTVKDTPTSKPKPKPSVQPKNATRNTTKPVTKPAFSVTPISGTFYVTGAANVRSGPGVQYPRIGGLALGQQLQVDGKANGWYRFKGNQWISGSLVSTKKPIVNKPPVQADDGVLWSDNIQGWLPNPKSVPCGGLWRYTWSNYYVREINCDGSRRYLGLQVGQKVKLGGKSCRMVASQNLNYHSDDMADVKWLNGANTIVQTCYVSGGGNVKLVQFRCD